MSILRIVELGREHWEARMTTTSLRVSTESRQEFEGWPLAKYPVDICACCGEMAHFPPMAYERAASLCYWCWTQTPEVEWTRILKRLAGVKGW